MIVPLPGGGCEGLFDPATEAESLPPGRLAPGCTGAPLAPNPDGFTPPLKPLPGSPLPGRFELRPPFAVPDPVRVVSAPPPLVVSAIGVVLPLLLAIGAADEPAEFPELPLNDPPEPPFENPPPPPK